MNKPVLMRISDDAVVENMEKKSYSLAYVLLEQMQKEAGILSKANQLRMCQCLYFNRRYLAALEKCKNFIESGNAMREMFFLRGMCHYQLGQWTIAAEMFSRHREWNRWLRKAQLRKEGQTDKTVVIGEMPTRADDEKAAFAFEDRKTSIKIQIPLAGVDPSELKVNLNEYWLELAYDDGRRKFTKSVELFDKVVPKSLKLDVKDMSIEMEIDKVKEAPWPTLNGNTEPAIETNFDNVLEKMNIVQEFTDEEASELFESLIPQLKEEAPNIASWFESL